MCSENKGILEKKTIRCGNELLDISNPVVMAIINVTPDSFYDGGKLRNSDEIVEHAGHALEEGASILDIGGYSSRPGAEKIPTGVETERVLPAISAIKKAFPEAIISIDTFRSEVAEKAVGEGASIVNDIAAGEGDPKMFEFIMKEKLPYIMMHMQGTPETMQNDPTYEDVARDILKFFSSKIEDLRSGGVADIILDPGFGFGKTPEHNYSLLKKLNLFREIGFPVMAGVSRKSMINKVLNISPDKALNGTTVLNTIALLNGANILRVHDVREAVESIKLVEFYRQC